MADTDEKRNEAIMRAILSPTRELPEDVQRGVDCCLKKAAKSRHIAAAQCLQSPTGAHHWVMSWPEGRYIGTCRYCNEVRDADPTLGLGGKPCGIVLEGSASNREYPLQRDFVEGE